MRINAVLLMIFLSGCESPRLSSSVKYVKGTAPCATLTPRLIEYIESQVEDFFNDHQFGGDIYVNDTMPGNEFAYPDKLAIRCGSTEEETCNLLSHGLIHQEYLNRFGDPNYEHRGWAFSHFQSWPCMPNVAKENGF